MVARTQLERMQREMLVDSLERNDWKRDAVAKDIGIGRTTLWRWMRRFKLKRPTLSPAPAADRPDAGTAD